MKPLKSSSSVQDDPKALRQRLAGDGYLYLPRFFAPIYKSFKGFAYERYWRDFRLQIVPRDMRFTAGVFAMALRAAGDPLAVPHLRTLRRFVAAFPAIPRHFVRCVELLRAEAKQPLGLEDIDALIEGVLRQGAVLSR